VKRRVWISSGDNHNNNRPWGGKGTSPYVLACTVKSRPSLGPMSNVNKEKEKKLVVLPKLGCLATYIGYISRISTCLC
jgi:hypothetical protein